MRRLPLAANHLIAPFITTRSDAGHMPVSRPKMIKTFSLSALFFLSIGLLLANAAQLPIA